MARLQRRKRKRLVDLYLWENFPGLVPAAGLLHASSYYDWTVRYRRTIEGRDNVLEHMPMWREIYRDGFNDIFLLLARQSGKTTYNMGRLAYNGTSRKNHTTTYVTFEDESLATMSNDKFRFGVLVSNPEIAALVNGPSLGEVHKVTYATGSRTNLVTHAHGWAHVVGKSVGELIADEAQELDWDSWHNANETQSWTHGRIIRTGIGGYADSAYHDFWKESDQREWEYDDRDWRDGLKFDAGGLVWGKYLSRVLAGRWNVTRPGNSGVRHGYHLSQYDMPTIPLTVDDALKKYRARADLSIEHKRAKYTAREFDQYVLARFTRGQKKPFDRGMLERCFDRSAGLVPAGDVDYSLGPVIASTDYGGGSNAYTVPVITQVVHRTAPIFNVLHIEKLMTDDVDEQANILCGLFDSYNPDFIAHDAGGGTHQMQTVEKRYRHKSRKIEYRRSPADPLPGRADLKKLRARNAYWCDRSYAIERTAELFKRDHAEGGELYTRYYIPAEDENVRNLILDHFLAVEGEETRHRGRPYTEYVHPASRPDDAVHAFSYNHIGWDIYRRHYMHRKPDPVSVGADFL